MEGPALMSSLPRDSLTLIPVKPLIHSNPPILCWQTAVQNFTSLLISPKFQNNGNYSLCHNQLESRENPASALTSFLSEWSSWKYLPTLKDIPSYNRWLWQEGWFSSWRSQCSSVPRHPNDQMRPKTSSFGDLGKVRAKSKLTVLFCSRLIDSHPFFLLLVHTKVIWNSNIALQSVPTLILGNMLHF